MAEDPLSDKGRPNSISRRSVLAGFGAALGAVGCARVSANPSTESRVMELTIVRRLKFGVPNYAHRLAWSHDGHRLALGGVLDARLSVWDVETGSRLPAPGDQTGGTHALAYSPDGRHLAVARAPAAARNGGQERYTVSLWDARTGGLVANIVEPDQAEIPMIEARFVTFSPDGRYLAIVYGKQVALYAIDAGGNPRRVLVTDTRALSCAFRPDGGALVCQEIGWNPRAVLLRVPDGVVLDAFEGPLATAMALSPDGSLLARAGGERVAITNTSGQRTARTLSIQEETAFVRLSFSADGRWLAAMSRKRLDVWDIQSWSHRATLVAQTEHADLFQDAAFSPREQLLVVAGGSLATIWKAQDR